MAASAPSDDTLSGIVKEEPYAAQKCEPVSSPIFSNAASQHRAGAAGRLESGDSGTPVRLTTTTAAAAPSPTPGAAGSQAPIALPSAAATASGAAASTAMASLFNGFGVGPGFLNAAAFAAAAAAAGMTANNTSASNPLLTLAKAQQPSALGSASIPESKRRKRGRSTEPVTTTADVKAEGPSSLRHAGSPLQPLATKEPAEGLGSHPPTSGGGILGTAWTPQGSTGVNVLTPNAFGGEMSNQERKERRKIRNRMSAQQHRERQRQRVDTLEDCLRQRDAQIAKLHEEVASLKQKNERLTSRVLQLEAGECPDLHAVLNGLADEAALSRQPSVGGGTEVPRVPSAKRGACLGDDDTDGGGGTTDPAHSSSESDSEDLSPISNMDQRSGQPSTPPLSPVRLDRANPDRFRLPPAVAAEASLVDSGFVNVAASADPISSSPLEGSATPCTAGLMTEGTAGEDIGNVFSGGKEAVQPSPAVLPAAVAAGTSPFQAAPTNKLARAETSRGGDAVVGLGMFGDVGGGCMEDDLTIAALDPMEIDALLAGAGGVDHEGGSGGGGSAVVVEGSASSASGMHTSPCAGALALPVDLEQGSAPAAGSSNHGGVFDTAAGAQQQELSQNLDGEGLAALGLRGGSSAPTAAAAAGRGSVASTVVAGVMGALCLAGVVMNSGSPGGGAIPGKELVVSTSGAAVPSHGGRRILSATDDDDEGELANMTDASPWVLHPVEAEPWRWRVTAARERRAPWVWERALDLFGNAGVPTDNFSGPVSECHTGNHNGPEARMGAELIRSDDLIDDYNAELYPPIAPPEASGEGFVPAASGKELDLYRAAPAPAAWRGVEGSPRDASGRGRAGGAAAGANSKGSGGGPATTPAGVGPRSGDHSSYLFCPAAHGMMSGGMIDRASKATYDHHHPGARPCPDSMVDGAPRHRGTTTSSGKTNAAGGATLNAVQQRQQQQLYQRRQPASPSSLRPRLLAGVDNPDHVGSKALVASRSGRVDANSDSNINTGIVFGSERGRDAVNAPAGGSWQRRRGPAPIHYDGDGSTHDRRSDERSEGAGHQAFRRDVAPPDDTEFMTMLVPSGSLDWGSSSLAVRSALNATSDGAPSVNGSGSWVEIECRILYARLVQDVTFAG